MYEKIINENKLLAFKHFVITIKKQNENTITNEGDIFSYITKRGKQKKYKYFKNIDYAIKSGYKIIRVNGFVFGEIKE